MATPAWMFFSFWSLISITFLHFGFHAFDRSDLSNSISPVVMSFFKHSLAISSCSSSSYALVFRPQLHLAIERRYFWVFFGSTAVLFTRFINESSLLGVVLLALIKFFAYLLPGLKIFADRYWIIMTMTFLSSELFSWYFPIWTLMNLVLIVFGEYHWTRGQKIGIGVHMAVETSLFLVSGRNTEFFPILVLFVSFFISASWAALSGIEPHTTVSWEPVSGDECFRKLLPLALKGRAHFSIFMERKSGKIIGFAVGMVGTVLFQSFFRLTTFDHAVAFLYVAVVWVANLALLGVSSDFGVFNFVVGNVIVGCTVSQFGLGSITTWVVYGASLLLFGLRLKLESASLVYREGEQQIRSFSRRRRWHLVC